MEPQLQALVEEFDRQTEEALSLAGSLSEARFRRRTHDGRWSVAEHLSHLALTNRPYVEALCGALERARARGWTRPGPYRGGWLVARMITATEPPVRRRLKTFRRLNPLPDLDRATVIREFQDTQADLVSSLRAADGVDLGRAKMRSPYFGPLRMSLIHAYEFLAAHNRRHLWHMRNAVGEP